MRKSKESAIIFFSESAHFQTRKKSFSIDSNHNLKILQQLRKKAFNTISKAEIPVFSFTEANQIGNCLAERLTNAISHVFNEGYEKVVVVGDDCPDLSIKDLLRSRDLLHKNQFVIGADKRGGAYLLAICKEAFCPEEFLKLDWQSSSFNSSLQSVLKAKKITHEFLYEQKADFNEETDISINWNISSAIRKIIEWILNFLVFFHFYLTRIRSVILQDPTLRRGPPGLASF